MGIIPVVSNKRFIAKLCVNYEHSVQNTFVLLVKHFHEKALKFSQYLFFFVKLSSLWLGKKLKSGKTPVCGPSRAEVLKQAR